MIKKVTMLFFILFNSVLLAQESYSKAYDLNTKYPQNYFQNPIDIPLILAGTFGELRTNHFHAGIDIKTKKKEGLNILAIADGYVSRIKIKHWGYGKAIYVTHPNGYTSVYAHLQKFAPSIEAYIKKQQYRKESYEIQLFPKENELQLKKGELLALSGNTGGSTAPHLHFEIRDSKTEKTINPLLFGIHVKDNTNPVIQSAFLYNLDDENSKRQKLQFTKQKNGDLLTNTIHTYGKIGLGVKSFDRLDGANNKNGLYKLELFVNKQKHYQHKLETFSFAESKYINLLVDYAHHFYKRERIQKCFVVPNNKLSIYDDLINKGVIDIENGLTYTIEIVASDIKGNKTKLKIPIVGKRKEIKNSVALATSKLNSKTHYFKRTDFNTLTKDNVTIAIPKYSFYKNVNFNFSYHNGIAKIHNASVPLHKNFTLTFDVSNYSVTERKKLFIAKIKKSGNISYVSTKRKEHKLYTNTKKLGHYKLVSDSKKPTITPINFKDKQWLTNKKTLKVRIKDALTGIKTYRATIDNQWILMEYEPKTGVLTYDFNDKKFTTAKHNLKIVVSDKVNNTKTYIATFYRNK
ncbi:MAG: M23 family metallopeptidase [Flavobacteriaceae bacterium]|nr:M23 family metallopeptidase [Flavobacteriaceae bacterium]